MYPADQIDELKELCPGLCHFEEAGTGYLVLPAMEMPPGCQPAKVNMLLCPGGRDGYTSRLFFSEKIQTAKQLNWNALNFRIGERIWHGYSWRTPGGNLRLAQMVITHLSALQCN